MDDLLGRAREVLERRGILEVMTKIVSAVYARNAARYDPVLGDDQTTFGITTSRNIANLTVQRLKDRPGVRARMVETALEVLCDGYVLRQYKLAGATRDVSVASISWEDSEAKLDGAIENSSRQLSLDADLDTGTTAFGGIVPPMRHLRLVHAGDLETGECVIYLGIPRDDRDGGSPWFDVALIYGEPGEQAEGDHAASAPADPRQPHGPSYDTLPLPDIGVGRREPLRKAGRPDVAT
jgi:hypothetical protein